jgi:hypothetical protein
MKRWFEKYEQLGSVLFTLENSGKRLGDAPPYRCRRNAEYDIIDIRGEHSMNKVYRIVGYTENPPFFPAGYSAVAIMFERIDTSEKMVAL